VPVKDIWRAISASNQSDDLTNVNDTLSFDANDCTDGTELWKSDGAAARHRDDQGYQSGAASPLFLRLTNVNGILVVLRID
jgi:hypothetical protein